MVLPFILDWALCFCFDREHQLLRTVARGWRDGRVAEGAGLLIQTDSFVTLRDSDFPRMNKG